MRPSAKRRLPRRYEVKSLFLLALLVPAMLLGTQRVMVNEEFTGTW
jgi:hypothetical protein